MSVYNDHYLSGNKDHIHGDACKIYGNASKIKGFISGINGNVSYISGDVSGVTGNLDKLIICGTLLKYDVSIFKGTVEELNKQIKKEMKIGNKLLQKRTNI